VYKGAGIMTQNCTPTLHNNTITQNYCTNTTNLAKGGGLLIYSSGTFQGLNNIIWGNQATVSPNIFGTVNFNYSCTPDSLTGEGNITADPQFLWPMTDNFHLSAGSPCIDTGDPGEPPDPDGSRSDMGALYFDHLALPPNLDITMTPINPPIVIPANGGSFNFNVSIVNHGPGMPFWVWVKIKPPEGGYPPAPYILVQINLPINVSITRMRTVTVPASWAPGLYTNIGYVNTTFAYPAIDSSWFTFTKSITADGGPVVWEASCTGDPFPYQVEESAVVAAKFALVGNSPNPFNPTTTISFTLPEVSRVTLNVYDVAGRQVAQLVNGTREAGSHEVIFDGSNLASGLYLYTLTAGSHSATGKMMLIK
jgi:hypothetical protein